MPTVVNDLVSVPSRTVHVSSYLDEIALNPLLSGNLKRKTDELIAFWYRSKNRINIDNERKASKRTLNLYYFANNRFMNFSACNYKSCRIIRASSTSKHPFFTFSLRLSLSLSILVASKSSHSHQHWIRVSYQNASSKTKQFI